MAKKQKEPVKTCADCIHESACRVWNYGRFISDDSASVCPNHETVNESGAYLCGVLDERKRKQTNADRIRAMSDEELAKILNAFTEYFSECNRSADEVDCKDCELNNLCQLHEGKAIEWLQQPTEGE